MVIKILKLFILVGVLGIHTGCFQMSNDSGDVSPRGKGSTSDSTIESFEKPAGTLSLLPSKEILIAKYQAHDYDTLSVSSSDGDTSAGKYSYSKEALNGVERLDLVVRKNKTYVLTLFKGSDVVLQERLK